MNIAKILHEVRTFLEKSTGPRVLATWTVTFPLAVGYMLSQVPWDKVL